MPSTQTDLLNGLSTSVAVKGPCTAVAITAITLSGEQTVNGVAVVSGDRVLVTAQASSVDNGIYVVSTSAWQRAADFDGNRDVRQGTLIVVNRTTGQDYFYQVDTADPITIGTTGITFTLTNDPNVTYDITDAEISAGVTPSDYSKEPIPANVLRYGAVADGSTDNTAAFQKAYDSLPSKGGTIYVPGAASTYNCDSALTFSSSKQIQIKGDGPLNSLIVYTGSSTFITTDSAYLSMRDVTIKGIADGDQIYTTGSTLFDVGGLVRAYNCEFSRAQVLFEWSGGYYHKFFDCHFLRAQTLFNNWNANNVAFFGCLWSIFQDGFIGNAGVGPVSFFGGSIESWYSSAFGRAAGDEYSLIISGAYVEPVAPDTLTPDGIGSDGDTYGDGGPTICTNVGINGHKVTLSGNSINLRGLKRIVTSTSALRLESRNTLLAVDGDSADYLNDILYSISAGSTGVMNDVLDGSLFTGTYTSRTGTQGLTIYDPINDVWNSAEGIGLLETDSYTGTLTGCTTSPTGTVEYVRRGDLVTIYVPGINGTSNSTAATITGMPTSIRPSGNRRMAGLVRDNAVENVGIISLATNGTLFFYWDGDISGFTASGSKGSGLGFTCTYKV